MASTNEKAQGTFVTHPFPALYDSDSKILILGSFPSVKSREQQFFYGHKQNRFWKVIAALTDSSVPETIEEKRALLLTNHIALWDVIASCTIVGSSDASIRDAKPNNLSEILANADIRQIYTNGAKSNELYRRYMEPVYGRPAVKLPSTSPANAAFSLERLIQEWSVILHDLQSV